MKQKIHHVHTCCVCLYVQFALINCQILIVNMYKHMCAMCMSLVIQVFFLDKNIHEC